MNQAVDPLTLKLPVPVPFAINLPSVRAARAAVSLTKAEIEVLRMLADGNRVKQIAFDLGISGSAVKARLQSARKKLFAKTTVQSVSRAIILGLLRE